MARELDFVRFRDFQFWVAITDTNARSDRAENDVEYDKVKKDFRAAQTVEQILREMLSSATDATERLKDEFNVMTNKRVLHTLPDEILAIILEHCCIRDAGLEHHAINSMLLVSRRFHNVLLGIPSVWSRLPPFFVKRSKRFASYVTTPVITLIIRGVFNSSLQESRRVVQNC